ncbi:hypothetical protein LCGC14_0674120 [marine sediment metagenome]|uniref:Uncharacterized protein n=1 Tax=marine sediment metagenome TaxID=412755 RepID=A0A0F9QQ59_9ZZZZ
MGNELRNRSILMVSYLVILATVIEIVSRNV